MNVAIYSLLYLSVVSSSSFLYFTYNLVKAQKKELKNIHDFLENHSMSFLAFQNKTTDQLITNSKEILEIKSQINQNFIVLSSLVIFSTITIAFILYCNKYNTSHDTNSFQKKSSDLLPPFYFNGPIDPVSNSSFLYSDTDKNIKIKITFLNFVPKPFPKEKEYHYVKFNDFFLETKIFFIDSFSVLISYFY